jgi:hypothetical protein
MQGRFTFTLKSKRASTTVYYQSADGCLRNIRKAFELNNNHTTTYTPPHNETLARCHRKSTTA